MTNIVYNFMFKEMYIFDVLHYDFFFNYITKKVKHNSVKIGNNIPNHIIKYLVLKNYN